MVLARLCLFGGCVLLPIVGSAGDAVAAENSISHRAPVFLNVGLSPLLPAALQTKTTADVPLSGAAQAPNVRPTKSPKVARVDSESVAGTAALPPSLVIDINLSSQRMTVRENGRHRHTWSISSGKRGYATPTGSFQPAWMARMWYSRQYDYAPMPHAIFFSGGAAIHATYATGKLGQPASHGCVRLAAQNAKTLYKMVTAHGKSRTRIRVRGTPRYPSRAAAADRRRARDASVVRYSRYRSGVAGSRRSTVRYSPWGY